MNEKTDVVQDMQKQFDTFFKMYQTICSITSLFPIPDAEKRDILCEFRAGFLLAKEVMAFSVEQKVLQMKAVAEAAQTETDQTEKAAAPAA